MYVVVDAGNTRIKLALFKHDELVEVLYYSSVDELQQSFTLNAQPTIISSVLNENETAKLFEYFTNAFSVKELECSLLLAYETPESLGQDRLANAVALTKLASGNRLSIDMGTCIKFDFVDEKNVYRGGSIAPGIQMRFKAMHEFTGKLPLFEAESPRDFIGKNTKESMQVGVLVAVQKELEGLIGLYRERYPDLTIFVSGGDAKHFDFSAKNYIFANENLTLIGLYHILLENA